MVTGASATPVLGLLLLASNISLSFGVRERRCCSRLMKVTARCRWLIWAVRCEA
jgi:hypothetical protein